MQKILSPFLILVLILSLVLKTFSEDVSTPTNEDATSYKIAEQQAEKKALNEDSHEEASDAESSEVVEEVCSDAESSETAEEERSDAESSEVVEEVRSDAESSETAEEERSDTEGSETTEDERSNTQLEETEDKESDSSDKVQKISKLNTMNVQPSYILSVPAEIHLTEQEKSKLGDGISVSGTVPSGSRVVVTITAQPLTLKGADSTIDYVISDADNQTITKLIYSADEDNQINASEELYLHLNEKQLQSADAGEYSGKVIISAALEHGE